MLAVFYSSWQMSYVVAAPPPPKPLHPRRSKEIHVKLIQRPRSVLQDQSEPYPKSHCSLLQWCGITPSRSEARMQIAKWCDRPRLHCLQCSPFHDVFVNGDWAQFGLYVHSRGSEGLSEEITRRYVQELRDRTSEEERSSSSCYIIRSPDRSSVLNIPPS